MTIRNGTLTCRICGKVRSDMETRCGCKGNTMKPKCVHGAVWWCPKCDPVSGVPGASMPLPQFTKEDMISFHHWWCNAGHGLPGGIAVDTWVKEVKKYGQS